LRLYVFTVSAEDSSLPVDAYLIYSCFFPMPTTGERFERAVAILARLRGPGGCPWDREQTFDSIKPYTLEETYEVLEAIDNRDWDSRSTKCWIGFPISWWTAIRMFSGM
jgi:hypothetical protein